MSATIVVDTIHHVVYDSIHIVIDSSFSPQILRDSQTFFSNSFNWLLAIFGIFLAIIAIIFGFKLYHDLKSIDQKIADVAKRTADETNKKFERQIDAQNRHSLELAVLVKDMQEKIILNWITQGRLAETQKQFYHEFMCYDFALKEVVEHYDKTFAQYGKIAIEELIKQSSALASSPRKNKIIEEVISKINAFEKRLLNTPLDKDPNNVDDEKIYILSILSLCGSAKGAFERMIEEQ